jgi:acyl-CoA dehydrogenase
VNDLHEDLRQGVRKLCARYPDAYWRELDLVEGYPDAFIRAMTEAGYLAALIPEAYGGSGLGVTEASIILEEVHRSGGNAAAGHAQMYIWARCCGTALRRRRRCTCPRSPRASCASRPLASPSRTPARTP